MLFILIATLAVGLAAGGLVWGVRRLTGNRLPRYAMPIAAGFAMFAFVLWNDYSWFERMVASLPDDTRVARTYTDLSLWRPWTYLVPRINRFAAVDLAAARRHPDHPDLVLAEVVLLTRLEPELRVRQLFDCARWRRGDLTAETRFADDGRLDGVRWSRPDPEDPLVRAACVDADARS